MPQNLPSLNAVRAFEAASRLESASRAADELHVTHGAISRQIRALEAELATRLFDRAGRGLALTDAGRRLRDAAAGAFAQLREGCEELRRDAQNAPLVLGLPGSVLARWMIPRMQRLAADAPELRLHLTVVDTLPPPTLPGLDALLLLGEPPWPAGWQVDALAPERIAPVFSPRHPHAAALAHSSIAALLKEPLLHTASRPQAWPAWARTQRIASARLHYGQSFEHLYYMLEAATAGLGVAIAPEPLVTADIAAGRLIAPWPFRATRGTWALCSASRRAAPAIAKLGEWLRGQLSAA